MEEEVKRERAGKLKNRLTKVRRKHVARQKKTNKNSVKTKQWRKVDDFDEKKEKNAELILIKIFNFSNQKAVIFISSKCST